MSSQKAVSGQQQTMTIPERELPISYQPDVVVLGGGAAGVAAAIAASRNGASTLLIEQRGYLGGMGTAALVPAFCPYTDGEKPVVRGIGLDLMETMKLASGDEFLSMYKDRLDWVPIDVEVLKRVYDDAVLESGAHVLFHTLADQVLMDEGHIQGIVISNKTGRSVVQAKLYIDATGDADIAAMAGVAFDKGGNEAELQPGTMCFLVCGADKDRYDRFLAETGQKSSLIETIQEAMRNGDLPDGRKRISGTAWISKSVVGFNFGHIFGIDGTNTEDLSRAAIEGRRLIERQLRFLHKYVPGFEQAHLVHSGDQIGIRETRRIVGDYKLVVEDFINARTFEDDIARNSYFIDIHLANAQSTMIVKHLDPGESHGIPYRCMLPVGVENLIVPGRSVSSDRPVQGSVRVMPNCFAMGQAAGTAAAMIAVDTALQSRLGFRQVDIPDLQQRLIEQGAYLGDRSKIGNGKERIGESKEIVFEEETS
ncbi:FAD-dependent oxidoreductase [Paenibacillus agricola]|nr:FAD-dependent oxidoreductase [Paenibacillus agricola]